MKKILLTALVLASPLAMAETEVKLPNITIEKNDILMYKALDLVNKQCGSSIGIDTLVNPNEKISLNFDNIPCQKVIDLMFKFDETKNS